MLASLDRLIGAIPVFAQVAGEALCFSGACVWNQIHPFLGAMEGEMKGKCKKQNEELPLSKCHYLNLIQG